MDSNAKKKTHVAVINGKDGKTVTFVDALNCHTRDPFENSRKEALADRVVTFDGEFPLAEEPYLPKYPECRSGRSIDFYKQGYHFIDI